MPLLTCVTCGPTIHNPMAGKTKGVHRCTKCGKPPHPPRMMPRGFCTGSGVKACTDPIRKTSTIYWRTGKQIRVARLTDGSKGASVEMLDMPSVAAAKAYMATAT